MNTAVTQKYEEVLQTEKSKITELMNNLKQNSINIGSDVDQINAVIAFSLLSMDKGYLMYKRRLEDGLINEPNIYLETLFYLLNSLNSKQGVNKPDYIKNFGLNENFLKILSSKKSESTRIIFPLLLSERYKEYCLRFFSLWAHWFDGKAQESLFDEHEKSVYVDDFISYFSICHKNDHLNLYDVGMMLEDVVNVVMDSGFISIIIPSFIRRPELQEKILQMILSLKGRRNIGETAGAILQKTISSQNPSENVRKLVNICRLPVTLEPRDKILWDGAIKRARLPFVDYLQVYPILSEYIVEKIIQNEDEHPYFNGVTIELQHSFATLTCKLKGIETQNSQPLPHRYIKIGIKEKITKEKSGFSKLLDAICLYNSGKIEIPRSRESKDYDNFGVIAFEEVSGESFSQKYKNASPDKIQDFINKLFSNLARIYLKADTLHESLAKYYDLNKVRHITEEIKEEFQKKDYRRICLTHGDLTGDNIIIDEEKDIIHLIDFGEVDKSHWLKDFVTLESYIRIKLMDEDRAEESIYTDEKENLLNEWLTIETIIGDNKFDSQLNVSKEELKKAIYAIRNIRTIAQNIAFNSYKIKDSQFKEEYRLSLFYYLLRYLDFDDIKEIKKDYAKKLLESMTKQCKY